MKQPEEIFLWSNSKHGSIYQMEGDTGGEKTPGRRDCLLFPGILCILLLTG